MKSKDINENINTLGKLNFEESMKKLDEIANQLENGNLNLDESIKKFEEGMALSKRCNEFLNSAEKKITVLLNDGDNVQEEEFSTDSI